MVLTNCDKKFLKEALAEVIWQLREEKKCWATYEKDAELFPCCLAGNDIFR